MFADLATVPMIQSQFFLLTNDFNSSIKMINRHKKQVEIEGERLLASQGTFQDQRIVSTLEKLALRPEKANEPVQVCFNVPFPLNGRLEPRADTLSEITQSLEPTPAHNTRKSLALHGIGGVGKTQVAVQYAYAARTTFDHVLWVSADTFELMTKSYLEVAHRLNLFPSPDSVDAVEAMTKTKAWLADTSEYLPDRPFPAISRLLCKISSGSSYLTTPMTSKSYSTAGHWEILDQYSSLLEISQPGHTLRRTHYD
jgi:hypothetical protein